MKTKTVPVKDLRKTILQSDMTYNEAASHALKALKLNCLKEDVDVNMEDLLENLIGFMVQTKDHSIEFKVEEDRGDEILSWSVVGSKSAQDYGVDQIDYFSFNMDHAEACANEDAETLNQFILDFYGIKKRTKPKPTKKEVQAELRRITSELKNLTSQMNKLTKVLKGFA
jgi:hypothetical protein